MPHFFDLDGTLLDHEHALSAGLTSLISFAPELRIYAEEELTKRWEEAEIRHFSRFERGEITIEEHRRERMREVFSEKCSGLSDQELDGLYGQYLSGYQRNWRLYDDVLPALQKLASESMVLITNGGSKLQRAKIAALGLGPFFSEILISSEVGFAKPDHRIFELACDRLGTPISDVRFVGDSFTNDVKGSHYAGMNPIWLNRRSKSTPEPNIPHSVISSLTELIS